MKKLDIINPRLIMSIINVGLKASRDSIHKDAKTFKLNLCFSFIGNSNNKCKGYADRM